MTVLTKEQATQAARALIEFENVALTISNSKPAVLIHKGEYYIGSVQKICREDAQIVLIAKSSLPVGIELIEALQEQDPRPTYTFDDDLELAPRQNILGLYGDKLQSLSPEQTLVAAEIIKNSNIIEI